jgi:hypothetical protein
VGAVGAVDQAAIRFLKGFAVLHRQLERNPLGHTIPLWTLSASFQLGTLGVMNPRGTQFPENIQRHSSGTLVHTILPWTLGLEIGLTIP